MATSFDIIRHRRGWTQQSFAELNALPQDQLPRLDEALETLHRHKGGEITVLTDFDMDGTCAGVIMYAGLSELGFKTNLVIPDYQGSRDVEVEDIDTALHYYPDTTCIITCDEATNSARGIGYARARGLDVVITDHHHQNVDSPATVLLNPNAQEVSYSQPDICGAQVAFHLVTAYAKRYQPHTELALSMLRIFAGIGALADVMPLTGQTRDLIRATTPLMGLACVDTPLTPWGTWDAGRAMANPAETTPLCALTAQVATSTQLKNAIYGFAVLMQQFIAAKKLRSLDDVNTSFIGFTLAPTFNATRRVGGDMADAFYIFAPESVRRMVPDYDKTRHQAAAQLISNNENRKLMTIQALADLDSSTYGDTIYFSDAPAGILGLIATQITKATGKPSFVINPQTLSGSARAPEWFPVITVAETLDGVHAAGHEQACGVRLDDIDAGFRFKEAVADYMATLPEETFLPAPPDLIWSDIPYGLPLTDFYRNVDMPLPTLEDVAVLINHLDRIGPFGHGFVYPSIVVHTPLEVCSITELSDGKHLKITTPSDMDCLWWNTPVSPNELRAQGNDCAIEVELGIGEFKGVEKVQGIVRSLSVDGKVIA